MLFNKFYNFKRIKTWTIWRFASTRNDAYLLNQNQWFRINVIFSVWYSEFGEGINWL